jgi:hypothetical protein
VFLVLQFSFSLIKLRDPREFETAEDDAEYEEDASEPENTSQDDGKCRIFEYGPQSHILASLPEFMDFNTSLGPKISICGCKYEF